MKYKLVSARNIKREELNRLYILHVHISVHHNTSTIQLGVTKRLFYADKYSS